MRRYVRPVLAILAGIIVGSVVNMGLIMLSSHVIPAPAGADVTTAEGLKASMHLFEPKHFIFPFLAHFLGTFVGAVIATLVTPDRSRGPAYIVGAAFLLGGFMSVLMLPAPFWFIALDLLVAYLPAAWLGHRVVARRSSDVRTASDPV